MQACLERQRERERWRNLNLVANERLKKRARLRLTPKQRLAYAADVLYLLYLGWKKEGKGLSKTGDCSNQLPILNRATDPDNSQLRTSAIYKWSILGWL